MQVIEWITGNKLSERWGVELAHLFQIAQKGLPAYTPWEDPNNKLELLKYNTNPDIDPGALVWKTFEADLDYTDEGGNVFRRVDGIEDFEDMLDLIFKISDIESFENEFGFTGLEQKTEPTKE
jgi:hypothetical protein